MPLTPDELQRKSQAAKVVQDALTDWNLKTWHQLLADDVAFTLNLGAIGTDARGDLAALGTQLQVTGRDAAKEALREVYGDLKRNVSIIGHLVAGNEAIVFGGLNVTFQDRPPQSLPIAAYLQFNERGKIQRMTIGTIDLRPLLQGVREAAAAGRA